jgi:hypothetical protein
MKPQVIALALAIAVCHAAADQDAKTVISNASKAMGMEGLNSINKR